MKTSFHGFLLSAAALAFGLPAFAQETPDMLSEALALVRQVENPAGQPPADADKIKLLTQAISEAQQAPNHRLKGHRVLAIEAIRLAIAELGKGDPTHQAATFLKTADDELSTSITLAGGTPPATGAAVTPQTASAYTALGDAKMRQSNWSGAVAAYDAAIKLDPKNVQAYLERGASKMMQNDWKGGMADYDQAIAIDPASTEAYLKRAEAKQGKDPQGAIADYEHVIAIDPKNKEAYKGIADVHWMHQDYVGTIAAYDEIIALDPKDWYAYSCRAMAKDGKGDVDGAIADYGQTISILPTNADAFHNRADVKRKKGDLAGALADLNQAITLGMHEAYVYRERAEVEMLSNDLDGAAADYDKVIALDPKNDDVFVNLDDVYANRGDIKLVTRNFDGAIADYNQAIALKDQTINEDYFGIWMAQTFEGKKADADAQLSKEMAKSLDFDWFWDTKITKFLLGQMNEADLMQAATSSPDAEKAGVCQAWCYAGMKQLIAGNKSAAADDFTKCLAANQKDERITSIAKAELKALRP